MNTLGSVLRRSGLSLLLYWRTLRSPRKRDLVAVTYANDKHTDGAAAQLHRIYGVYALSRLLNLQYIHSPLNQIDYQGLAALERNSGDPEIVSRYNRQFNIASDTEVPENFITCELRDVTLRRIRELENRAKKDKTFILARVLYPFKITDVYPIAYESVKNISPFLRRRRSPIIRVAMHVRRGDLFVGETRRMLPNTYYISVVERIRSILDALGLNYTVELHTEIATKSFTVLPSHHGISERISEPIVIDPKSGNPQEFDAIPGLQKFINDDPIETLEKLATADVLIMSHSSFSYLPAILNVNGIAIYHPFWHSKMRTWLTSDDSGKFSSKVFLKRIHQNLKRRSIDQPDFV